MPQYDETAPKSHDSHETFATPLLAAELRALHDELAVAASDNVSLADALEKQRRQEREAQSALTNALSPDKRPSSDEDLAVFAQGSGGSEEGQGRISVPEKCGRRSGAGPFFS